MAREQHALAEGRPPALPPRDDFSPLSEMLAREPSRVTRRFLYALVLALVAAIVAGSILRVDVTVTAPAVLLPEGKALPIQPEVAGTVVEVKVREGTRVARGDVLAVLESEKAGDQLFALSQAGMKWKNAEHNLRVVLPVEQEKIRGEIRALENEIASAVRERAFLLKKCGHEVLAFKLVGEAYAEQVAKLNEVAKRLARDFLVAKDLHTFRLRRFNVYDRLFKGQAASQLEMLSTRRELEEARAGVEKVRSLRREATNNRNLARKNYLHDTQLHNKTMTQLEQDLEANAFRTSTARSKGLKLRSEGKLKQLEAETGERTAYFEYDLARRKAALTRHPLNRQTVEDVARGSAVVGRVLVVAPVAGRVGIVKLLRRGEAVERGQTMMTLLPDGPLVVELRIANKDVALVKPGQPIKLKLDAFPFAEYGSVHGELTNVPPDAEAVDTPADSFYRATARLNQQSVRKHGKPVALLSGMTATAEVVTERKTVLELILTPLLEPFQK